MHRSEMASGPSFTAASGSSEAAMPLAVQGAALPADGRQKKRLPAAFSRKLRNFCDMLTLGK